MLAAGAAVNASSAGGQTALILASVFGHREIVAVLLLAGANTSIQDGRGLTAAEWSIRRGFLDIAQLIENAPQHARGPRHPPLPKLEKVNQVATPEPVAAQIEVITPPAEPVTPKLGGAAAAILRTNAARMDQSAVNHEVTEVPSLDEPVVLFNDSLLAEVTHEHADKPGQLNEPQFQPPVNEFLGVEPSEKTSTANSTHELVSDEQVAAGADSDEIAFETDDSETATAVSISANETEIPIEEIDPAPSLRPERMAPAFRAHSGQPHSSGRTIVWAMVIVTLGASMYGAYRLNNYIFRSRAAAPAVAPVTPPKVAELVPARVPAKTLPLIGGELIGAELNVPEPSYPANGANDPDAAKSGKVIVGVTVNQKGRVVSARTIEGDWSLRAAAIAASRKATFDPAKVVFNGRTATGTITYNFVPPGVDQSATASASPETAPSPTPQTTPPAGNTATEGETADYRTPITGGDLAGTEWKLPTPNYPNSARTQGVSAVITITVRVNRRGRVISWLTGTGDSRLRAAALKAAQQSTFHPEKLPGKGEVVGTITYNFR